MAANYWLKMYHEALRDHKLALLPDNLWRRFWECCLLAGERNEGGFLPDLREMSFVLQKEQDTLRAELGQLAAGEFLELKLDDDGEERWFVTNFEKRQAPSPNAVRQREYRKRQRKERKEAKERKEKDNRYTDNIPLRNGNVTGVTKRNALEDKYIPPDPQPVVEIKTALSETTKTARLFNEEDYDKAAYALLGFDATPDAVRGFGEWWGENGYYPGKPALKSLVSEWRNYQAGVKVKAKNETARAVPNFDNRVGGAY